MAAKKVTRKQLLKEPDEFITFSSRLFQFVIKYKTRVLICLAIGFIIMATITGMMYFSKRSEEKAFALMQQAAEKYNGLLQTAGPVKACQDVQKDFEFILKNYKNRLGAELARISYADILYRAGEFDQAIAFYREALSGKNNQQPIKYRILSGLGYSLTAKKEYQEAAESFEKIANGPESIMKDEALYNLGFIYGAMGDAKKSKAAYERIVSEYPNSIYIELAKAKTVG